MIKISPYLDDYHWMIVGSKWIKREESITSIQATLVWSVNIVCVDFQIQLYVATWILNSTFPILEHEHEIRYIHSATSIWKKQAKPFII